MENLIKRLELAIPDDFLQKEDILKEADYNASLLRSYMALETEAKLKRNTVMSKEAIDLFLENSENKGLCKGLEAKVKVIERENKKDGTIKKINYLPWAVVERIFRLQGGNVEVVNWKFELAFDSLEYDAETGEIAKGENVSLFMHLRGTWNGVELDEYYPYFDSTTSKVIRTPDSQQINKTRQRGMVRLIARLAGIGLWIFEQQDTQFEDDGDNEVKVIEKEDKKIETKEEPPKKPKEKKNHDKKVEEDKKKADAMDSVLFGDGEIPKDEEVIPVDDDMPNVNGDDEVDFNSMFFGEIPKDEEVIPVDNDMPNVSGDDEDYPQESEEYSNAILEIKGYVKEHKETIAEFKKKKNKELLKEFTYKELKELISLIKK